MPADEHKSTLPPSRVRVNSEIRHLFSPSLLESAQILPAKTWRPQFPGIAAGTIPLGLQEFALRRCAARAEISIMSPDLMCPKFHGRCINKGLGV